MSSVELPAVVSLPELDLVPGLPSTFSGLADELLATMASIRRSGRLLARRPVELSTLTGAQLELVRLVRRRPGVSVAGPPRSCASRPTRSARSSASSPTPGCSMRTRRRRATGGWRGSS